MYVYFQSDHLALDNQLACSFLSKTTSCIPSFPQLSIVIWVGLRSCGLLPILFDMSVGITFCQLVFDHSCL